LPGLFNYKNSAAAYLYHRCERVRQAQAPPRDWAIRSFRSQLFGRATQLAIDAGIWTDRTHVDSADAYEIYGPLEQGTDDWEDWATLRST